MPRYDLRLHTSAEPELNDLSDTSRERLTDTLAAIASEREPTSHPSVRQLDARDNLFRVRVGDVRAVCRLNKPALEVVAVGPRKSVYDGIDDVVQQRVSA